MFSSLRHFHRKSCQSCTKRLEYRKRWMGIQYEMTDNSMMSHSTLSFFIVTPSWQKPLHHFASMGWHSLATCAMESQLTGLGIGRHPVAASEITCTAPERRLRENPSNAQKSPVKKENETTKINPSTLAPPCFDPFLGFGGGEKKRVKWKKWGNLRASRYTWVKWAAVLFFSKRKKEPEKIICIPLQHQWGSLNC